MACVLQSFGSCLNTAHRQPGWKGKLLHKGQTTHMANDLSGCVSVRTLSCEHHKPVLLDLHRKLIFKRATEEFIKSLGNPKNQAYQLHHQTMPTGTQQSALSTQPGPAWLLGTAVVTPVHTPQLPAGVPGTFPLPPLQIHPGEYASGQPCPLRQELSNQRKS